MAMDTMERPGVQEQYEVAGNTSDLRVEADKRGAGDVMIAGGYVAGVDVHGMSPTRLGMALLRLHSEWSSAAKPKRPGDRQIEAIAASLKAQDEAERANRKRENGELARLQGLLDGVEGEQRFDLLVAIMEQTRMYDAGTLPRPAPPSAGKAELRARVEADRWFSNELRILANSLKSRSQVWVSLGPWAAANGIAEGSVAEALQMWLAPACPVCEGHGLRKAPNAPALSARQCHKCSGTGKTLHKGDVSRVLAHMDYCIGLARGSLKKRLRRDG